MFGRHPTLPIDLVFPELQQPTRKQTHSQYVAQCRDRIEEVYKLASQQAEEWLKRKNNNMTKDF